MLLVQKKKLLLSGFILPSQENSIDLVSQKEKENTNLAQCISLTLRVTSWWIMILTQILINKTHPKKKKKKQKQNKSYL